MEDYAEEAGGSPEVLGVAAAGVLDDSGQLELLVTRWDEDSYDERLHAAIVAAGFSVTLRRPKAGYRQSAQADERPCIQEGLIT